MTKEKFELDRDTMLALLLEIKLAHAYRVENWDKLSKRKNHYAKLNSGEKKTVLQLEGIHRSRKLLHKIRGMLYVDDAVKYMTDLRDGVPEYGMLDIGVKLDREARAAEDEPS